ncbi:MAG: hypothetical protein P9L94_15970 [Candidatus Hinthialibacter antarcticus]|nr:hypothetical protein [Candidatus Hinthialibacter antarcticus]
MCADLKHSIPERSFGHCQWCDSDSVSLTYLMCPSCYRISNMIPSKAMVLMNNPKIKRELAAVGTSIRSIAPYVREFVFDPANKFPTEDSDKVHWKDMLANASFHANQDDVRLYVEQLMDRGIDKLPTKDQAQETAGIEVLLRFMMLVGIVRGVLRMKASDEDQETFDRICQEALASAAQNRSEGAPQPGSSDPVAEPSKRSGMHSARRSGR